jgi:hypothetical protein
LREKSLIALVLLLSSHWAGKLKRSGFLAVDEERSETIRPELVKAQTQLARLRFENWLLTFRILLPAQLNKIGTHGSSHNNDRRTQKRHYPV